MEEFAPWIAVANKLASLGLATLLILVLIGNKLRIWRWGVDFDELVARHKEEKAEILQREKYWKTLTERFLGLAESQGQLLRVREAEIARIDEANKGLLGPGPGM